MSTSALAGNLTPPDAPAPTMKTLDEVESRVPIHASDLPMFISQPGSYYLTENVAFPTVNTNCIIVTTSGVEIDLNGYTIKGPGADSGTSGDGVRYSGLTTASIVIRNGIVRDWGSDGIDLIGALNAKVSNVNSSFNRIYGVSVNTGTITDCRFNDNGTAGVILFGGSVRNCQLRDSNFGLVTSGSSGGYLANNQFFNHTSYAIRVNSGNFRIEDNVITGPGSATGIFVGEGKSLVIKNSVTNHSTSYNLHETCTAGPMITLTGGPLNSEHPWANFSD